MTSNDIYTPFTYCITFLPSGKRYYGARYSINEVAHPDQLWTTYFTSSKIIADLIEEHGVDSFTFEIRKIFKTRKETVLWESKFLTKIGAAKSQDWLNGNNGNGKFYNSPESTKKGLETKKKNGTLNSNSPESIQRGKDTKIRNGSTNSNSPVSIQKAKDTRKRNGTGNGSTIESIQKQKDTKIRNGTMNPTTPESVQRMLDTKKERNIESSNPVIIQKMIETRLRNGYTNPSLITFLSIIETKKTYAKNILSRVFPEFKQFY